VGNRPEVVLADAGYRCEQSFVALEQEGIEALVALGREGKAALNLDAERAAASARMAQKLGTEAGKARYRRRKVMPATGVRLDQACAGIQALQSAGLAQGHSRMELGVPGGQSQAHACPHDASVKPRKSSRYRTTTSLLRP